MSALQALPMLRVHRAWQAAEGVAEQAGVSRAIALDIAREVIEVIGEGTCRWGRACVICRSLLEVKDGRSVCPQHGPLGPMDAAVLLISFDPIEPSR